MNLSKLLAVTLVITIGPLAQRVDAQWTRRLTQLGSCVAVGAIADRLSNAAVSKFVAANAARQGLSAAETEQLTKAIRIGVALAFCAGGAAVAGTTYARLSRRGQEAREREILLALDEAQPRTYRDPERPTLEGRITPQAAVIEGDRECRVVEDYLADGSQGDSALVRYCRTQGGQWQPQRL